MLKCILLHVRAVFLKLEHIRITWKVCQNAGSWVPPQRTRSGRSLVGPENLHFNSQVREMPLLPSTDDIISHAGLTCIYMHIKST